MKKKREESGAEEARRALEVSGFWCDLVHVRQAGSTNDLAKSLASGGAPGRTVVVADEQTAGRGRFGRRWIAPPCSSLLCSILFRPDVRPAQAHQLTMLCSMAAADAVRRLTDLRVELKWPNDLVVRSRIAADPSPEWRKLAGILTESSVVDSKLDFVVVGTGINVNVAREELVKLATNATSILAETGRRLSRWRLLIAFLQHAAERYEDFKAGESPRDEWAGRLVTLGRRVEVRTRKGTVTGVAEGVDEEGSLLLRTDRGSLRRLRSGDVTLAHGGAASPSQTG